jgi:hypothetical protein
LNGPIFPYSDERIMVEKIESPRFPESRGTGKAL